MTLRCPVLLFEWATPLQALDVGLRSLKPHVLVGLKQIDTSRTREACECENGKSCR